jgi:hypothetical protein
MSENNISKSITSNDTATKRNNNTNSQESAKIISMSEDESKNNNSKITKSGWLLKWTNYLKGM